MFQPRTLYLIAIVILSTVIRVVEHPPNFGAVGALALFTGAYCRKPIWAFIIPIGATFASDLGLGLLRGNFDFYTFYSGMAIVYGCYALYVALGFGVRQSWNKADRLNASGSRRGVVDSLPPIVARLAPVAGATLLGSFLFFLITNFGDWLIFYERTWAGLTQCFIAAIPFYRTTLGSDAFFALVFFGGYELLRNVVPASADARNLRTQ